MRLTELIKQLENEVDVFGDVEVAVAPRDERHFRKGYDSKLQLWLDVDSNTYML